MQDEAVKLEVNGSAALLTVNRPQYMNALNVDVLQALLLAFDSLSRHKDIRAVVITGAGEKAFIAGADISTMSQLGPRPIAEYIELGQRTMRVIENFELPVIAAVNGYALGGGLELALSCDIIVAAKTAKVGQPEVNLGIIPGFGGTQRLIQRCGVGAARRLSITGEVIAADEAYHHGIVDVVVESSELMSRVQVMTDLIAKKGPLAVRAAKRVIRQSQEQVLLSGLRHEVEAFLQLFGTADREEGMNAFLQKREPKFQGL